MFKDIFGSDSEGQEDDELQPIGTTREGHVFSRFSYCTKAIGEPGKDVAFTPDKQKGQIDDDKLKSTHQKTLEEIYKIVGSKQLTRSKMACAPS